MKILLFSILFFGLNTDLVFGQADTSARQLARLKDQVSKGSYLTAIPELEKMAQIFPKNNKVHQLLGEAYQESRLPEKAARSFEAGFQPKAKGSAKWLLPILNNHYQSGNYEKTKIWIEEINKRRDADGPTKTRAKQLEQFISEILKADTISSRYDTDTSFSFPNSGYADFAPTRMNDSTIIFSSLRQDSILYYDPSLPNFNTTKIHVFKTTSSSNFEKIEAPKVLSPPGQHSGNGSLSPDGKWFYFSRCKEGRNGKLQCAIFKAGVENGKFKNVEKLDESINKVGFNSSQPFIVVNPGPKNTRVETIYFVSDRKGGAGGMDLWTATYNLKKKKFGNASNLGRLVNSAGDESSPFIDLISNGLYFSSNGHAGFGGFDVFLSKKIGNGFGKPINVGKPVNSVSDDRYFSNDGSTGAFLASNRKGAHNLTEAICCEDIFYFKRLPKLDSLEWKTYQDKAKKVEKPASDLAKKELEKPGEKPIENIVAIARMDLPKVAEKPLPAPVKIVNDSKGTDVKTTMILKRISRNIQFEPGSERLTETTKPYLDSLAILMKANKKFTLQLIGHTDDKGGVVKNLNLSKKRAEAVKKYLIGLGVFTEKISTLGMGPKVPLLPNKNSDGSDNPTNRAQNRRVTLKLKTA